MHVHSKVTRVYIGLYSLPPIPLPNVMVASRDSTNHAALIVAIAQRQDRQAFATLFAHFAPRVKAYLQRCGAVRELAEEITQEAMLAVWRKSGQYDPTRAGAAAWIFAIARNLRVDALRRSRPLMPDYDPTDEPNAVPTADALVAASQQAIRIRAALNALPQEQEEALRLAFFEDQTHHEIEATLGVPLGTVKSRVRLAMVKLRDALKDDR